MRFLPHCSESDHGGRFPGAGWDEEDIEEPAGGGDLLHDERLIDRQTLLPCRQ
jgi:hypothetical protein